MYLDDVACISEVRTEPCRFISLVTVCKSLKMFKMENTDSYSGMTLIAV